MGISSLAFSIDTLPLPSNDRLADFAAAVAKEAAAAAVAL